MNDKLRAQLVELAKYLDSEFETWRAREKALSRPNPTEERFCAQVLGIQQSTYSRIKHAQVAVSDFTLLQLAFNLGSIRPLKIFGKDHLLANSPQALEIATRLRRARPEVRDAVAYLLDNDVSIEDLGIDKITTSPA